jgi:DNA-binding XRE family transcriptional regulator
VQNHYAEQKSYKQVCEGKEMKKIVLDDDEKDILESYERGEWVPVKNAKQEIKKLQRYDKNESKVFIPHEVVKKNLIEGKSLARAWREHKGLSQQDVAVRMGISQSSYAQMERPDARLRKKARQRIAATLEIDAEQLDV